jgi:hypothetical protein
MPINDYNEVFADPTPPRSGAADGAEEPQDTPERTGERRRPGRRPRALRSAETRAELGKEELGDWQWRLGASAGKAAADERRVDASKRAWEGLVAEARSAGVPERLLMAAALEADVDLPEGV